MRISDWSSDVCSSDLRLGDFHVALLTATQAGPLRQLAAHSLDRVLDGRVDLVLDGAIACPTGCHVRLLGRRSEERTSELQSLMRISYAVFCLKKKKKHAYNIDSATHNII